MKFAFELIERRDGYEKILRTDDIMAILNGIGTALTIAGGGGPRVISGARGEFEFGVANQGGLQVMIRAVLPDNQGGRK